MQCLFECCDLQMCTDLRLLASMKEIEEPFEKEQIGKLSFFIPDEKWLSQSLFITLVFMAV